MTTDILAQDSLTLVQEAMPLSRIQRRESPPDRPIAVGGKLPRISGKETEALAL